MSRSPSPVDSVDSVGSSCSSDDEAVIPPIVDNCLVAFNKAMDEEGIDPQSKQGQSLVSLATGVQSNMMDLVSEAANEGVDVDFADCAALRIAVKNEYVDVVQVLVENGAHIRRR